ncbi:MAG TPA: S8 family serine peptidase, partial [Myxococcota bacterium]|nr:S8 family serine peptidase [Myxococcota bacterium]
MPRVLALALCLAPAVALADPCPPQIGGDPQAMTASALPWILYIAERDQFSPGFPGLAGKPVHPGVLLIELKATTSVGQANGLLCSLGATLVGAHEGAPDVSGGVIAVKLPTAGHGDLAQKLDLVRQSPAVRRAIVDTFLGADQVPDRAGTFSTVPPDWSWWFPASDGGNWGMIALGAPEMWNLADAMFKDDLRSTVAVLDGGFSEDSFDVTYKTRLGMTEDGHGTHVSGIIGATWGNNHYVDGVHPTADLVVAPMSGSPSSGWFCGVYCWEESAGELIISNLETLLRADPDIVAVNLSLGFNWLANGVDSDTSSRAQEVARDTGDLFISTTDSSVERGRYPMPVFVVSAGNDYGRHARNNSPFASAGLRRSYAPVIVVEALEYDLTPEDPDYPYTLADYSNIDGHVSAPGSEILSLWDTLVSFSWGDAWLEYKDGTSMAAPHIAGLVGALYALDPALARPTSTTNAARDLLWTNDVAVG